LSFGSIKSPDRIMKYDVALYLQSTTHTVNEMSVECYTFLAHEKWLSILKYQKLGSRQTQSGNEAHMAVGNTSENNGQ
jgi:hypothetical protein